MRWLLDQGLPRATTLLLAAASHDAIHVGEIGMAAASDASLPAARHPFPATSLAFGFFYSLPSRPSHPLREAHPNKSFFATIIL